MKVRGYALPQIDVAGVGMRLCPHQASMLEEWDSHDAFLLVTKTGSGKTRAVALPVIKRCESAVFVYPTNALIAEQARAIQQLMGDEGVSYREWTPKNANEKLGAEDYALIQISSDTLEDFRKAWRLAHRSDALLRLLRQDKRKLVLINPDILFLVFALRYGRASAEAIGHLQAYATIVFDEFHLYHGIELAHALFMIHLTQRIETFKRVVLLSATPNAEVKPRLDMLLKPKEIAAGANVDRRFTAERIVAYDVELLPLLTQRGDVVETARQKLLELVDELGRLQTVNNEANARGDYVPCVVILNSVVNAIALEDALVNAGIPRQAIAPIRGLSSRSSRDVRGKQLVIGTSAIEVGIDFQADHLFFEAGDAASFMQRFGRIGRHRPGNAWLLCDSRESAALTCLGNEISRDVFERGIGAIYPHQDARAWFVSTCMGLVSVCAQAHNFMQKIAADRSADSETRVRVNQWMDTTLADYGRRLGVERILKQARGKLKRDWFAHYCEIDSFRTSLPSQEVWDVSEKERGREWNYDADVKVLLTRAERLWYNEIHDRLYVKGYGAWHYVWFGKSFEETPDLVGTIQTTADYAKDGMQFRQDGHLTSVSHVMHKPKHHIFVFVPLELGHELDWRLAWFRCGAKGRYLISFDGDALLLKEIYDRSKLSPGRKGP